VFWDEARQILIAGDHLLAHISSNPLVSRPLSDGSDARRSRALLQYIESMGATRELPAQLVLTGHGPPIIDHVQLIEERLRMHQRRARKILRMLHEDPLTAYELALRIWGNVAVTQAYLTLSEVLGHLDLLEVEGRVAEQASDGLSRFRALAA
jgi:glyoxylase-like metal-dependent hydrolase (beta-lactamase superfamily II)